MSLVVLMRAELLEWWRGNPDRCEFNREWEERLETVKIDSSFKGFYYKGEERNGSAARRWCGIKVGFCF